MRFSQATVNFSSVYGKGLAGGVAGTQVGFTVELRNQYNVPQARPAPFMSWFVKRALFYNVTGDSRVTLSL